jgi:AcrR family transcriptional regulator
VSEHLAEHVAGDFAPATSPQRARIRAAAMALVLEHGFERTSAEMIAARAGVSVADFNRQFADPRDCCLQVYLANIAEFDRIVFAAADRERGWRRRLRAAGYAALRYVRDRPQEARFNFIEMLEGGEEAQAYRDRYVKRIVDLIDAGRQELAQPDSVSRAVAEGAFGSVYEFLVKQFQDGGDIDHIDRFVPELMYIVVRPYVGHEAARQELAIPPPPEPVEEGG